MELTEKQKKEYLDTVERISSKLASRRERIKNEDLSGYSEEKIMALKKLNGMAIEVEQMFYDHVRHCTDMW